MKVLLARTLTGAMLRFLAVTAGKLVDTVNWANHVSDLSLMKQHNRLTSRERGDHFRYRQKIDDRLCQ